MEKEGTRKTIHHLSKLKGYKIHATSQIAFKGAVDGKEGKETIHRVKILVNSSR
jgi:hypothetical protein